MNKVEGNLENFLCTNRKCELSSSCALSRHVRTLIPLHHGRNRKSESFASCRGRVNIRELKQWTLGNLSNGSFRGDGDWSGRGKLGPM